MNFIIFLKGAGAGGERYGSAPDERRSYTQLPTITSLALQKKAPHLRQLRKEADRDGA
ncbi:hypothetical protein GCM10010512_43630 [Streptomyces thermoviolaceus subsp. thermoviolaceus]|nr:hypothetical protein GCM10010512_43630 [Streptomyces thermoviolaceus subsp. thermoviolaceus]